MQSSPDHADLLLLNTSNYPRVPIFPYAFVQVSEVARRHGLRVKVHDLLGTPPAELRAELRWLLERHRPRMVGIHLRQTDSLFVQEYREHAPATLPGINDPSQPPFFPVVATEAVIAHLRELCALPIVVGGHGFSASAHGLFSRLRPDFAVVGEPDVFFERFEDVTACRDVGSIANLMHWDSGKPVANERVYLPPSPNPEYTDETVDEVKKFYGARLARMQTMPLEVMRGCPYHCYFCCEPAVKGRSARVRDMDAVMEDAERLVRHGLTNFWLVCSELNIFGPDLALAYAERFIKLREKCGRPLRWHAFSLPVRMSEDVWRTLAQAGFRGGCNTFMSLDDENLERGRIPHRAEDAVREYEIIEKVSRERQAAGDDDIRSRGTLLLLLGNSFATVETVRRTIALLHTRGILETVRMAGLSPATRVFETLDEDAEHGQNPHFSFTGFGRSDERSPTADNLTHPTFEYPRKLLEHFGDEVTIDHFFYWMELTLLSRGHEREQDWSLFLANSTTPLRVAQWCSERLQAADGGGATARVRALKTERARERLEAILQRATVERLRDVFFPPPPERKELGELGLTLLLCLFDHFARVPETVLATLGVSGNLETALNGPIYPLLEALYRRYDSNDEAIAAVVRELGVGDDSLEALFARFFFYRRNIVIHSKYRLPLFGRFEEDAIPERRSLPMVEQ